MQALRKIFLFILLATGIQKADSQDLHFSQYFNAPLLVNPANTGFNPDFDYRIGGNYRNQWANVGTPYKSMSVWGDAQLLSNRFEAGWLGVGGALYKDVAGNGNLTATSGYAAVAYHQMLGYNSLISGGFSVGWVEKRLDIGKLTFDNQWTGKFFDSNIPTNEPFAFNQVSYFNLNMGLNYAYFASDNLYFNAGVSLMHINQPRESFFAPTVSDGRIDRRWTGFLNASMKIDNLWIVNPNVYISKMGSAWEAVLGFTSQRNLSGDGSNQLILGAYYRHKDAIVPVVGYEINSTRITFNYDATISHLRNINGSRGAYEISLVASGVFNNSNGRGIKCPTVKF